MLKHRFLTAIILIPLLVLAILFLPVIVNMFLFTAMIALGAYEWSRVIPFKSWGLSVLYILVILIGCFLAMRVPAFVVLSFGAIACAWGLLAIIQYERSKPLLGFEYSGIRVLLGILFLIPTWLSLMILYLAYPLWVLFYAIAIIWAADTGAYFVGKTKGKKPLAPKTSPKKTREGMMGGVLIALIVAVLGVFLLPYSLNQRLIIIGLAFIMILVSMLGDLFVSLLKRISGIKDSGDILPGHGGLLDRLDSIGAGLIIFTLGLLLFKISVLAY